MKTENTNTEVAVNNTTAVATHDDFSSVDLLNELKNPSGAMFCSIKDDGSRESKVAIFNAINRADKNVSEHLNEVLNIINVVAHPITLTDEETGEIVTCLRTVFITDKGENYVAVSGGVASALSRIFSIVGSPENGAWEKEPVKMKFKQVNTRNGKNKVTTIELV